MVELPVGSREFKGIVNLVDPEAAAELEAYLTSNELVPIHLRHGLNRTANLFLDHYLEEYDFLYFVTDHPIPTTGTVAQFEAVNRAAEPGGGNGIEIRAQGYKTNGRLKGVVGVQWRPPSYPPLMHETLHYWANHLDESFGFGAARATHYGVHWGFSSVDGVLGGFALESLRCVTPANALPPSCTPLGNGRTRYLAAPFWPNDDSYSGASPLELYLMGVLDKSEVPETFTMLDQAEFVGERTTSSVSIEADGISHVAFADILKRHGEKALLAPEERKLKAAFVVISASPASDEQLADLARYAAVFGGREEYGNLMSFADMTDNRMTMDTQLGARRRVDQPAPPAREAFACNVLTQDCPRAELSCSIGPVCVLAGEKLRDASCESRSECAPGLECMANGSAPDDFRCEPYCDSSTTSGAKACNVLCPGSFMHINQKGVRVATICLPGS